jgi:hypothetical protein
MYQSQLAKEAGRDVDASTAAQLWVIEVATPTMHRAHGAVGNVGTPIQAYCDLLEIRWLLSERAGHDVGTERALVALSVMRDPPAPQRKWRSSRCRPSRFKCLRATTKADRCGRLFHQRTRGDVCAHR